MHILLIFLRTTLRVVKVLQFSLNKKQPKDGKVCEDVTGQYSFFTYFFTVITENTQTIYSKDDIHYFNFGFSQ